MDDELYIDWDELAMRHSKVSYEGDEPSVDMGKWISYMPYHDEEQLQLQLDNLRFLPVGNAYGAIGFIFSDNINRMEQYLKNVSRRIKIENTETVLETEVYYTSKIEGAKTTRKRTAEIHNGSPIDENNKYSENMIKGNFEAVKLLNLYGNRIDEEKLYNVWCVLTNGCRDNSDIQGDMYRNDKVGVWGSDFEAVSVEEIESKMNDFTSFYNSSLLDDKPFIKACILHYNFETIHPFCDGNGRMGRLLMNNYLISRGIESCRAVSFSEQIDKNRGLYDAAFSDSENKYGDCTPFIEYMLETMAKSYDTALKNLQPSLRPMD